MFETTTYTLQADADWVAKGTKSSGFCGALATRPRLLEPIAIAPTYLPSVSFSSLPIIHSYMEKRKARKMSMRQ